MVTISDGIREIIRKIRSSEEYSQFSITGELEKLANRVNTLEAENARLREACQAALPVVEQALNMAGDMAIYGDPLYGGDSHTADEVASGIGAVLAQLQEAVSNGS